jgi:ankyrin repeat protein
MATTYRLCRKPAKNWSINMQTLAEVLSDFRLFARYPEDTEVTVESRTADGESPMHWMATLGDPTGIHLLAAAGAAVNAVDKIGNTPLHEAVLRRQVTAMKALLERGADVALKNQAGMTPLDIAISDQYQPTISALQTRM